MAIEALKKKPGELCAAIGPAIGFDAFEIGQDVAEQLRDALGASAMIEDRPDGKARADLHSLNRRLLLEAGLNEAQIEILPYCGPRRGLDFSPIAGTRAKQGVKPP